MAIWKASTPLDLRFATGQWSVEVIVSCWLNGILSTLVALLLLFRSLDAASSALLSTLRNALPFLPFPPPVTPTARSLITTEPPRYAAYGGGAVPLVERVATRTIPPDEEATSSAVELGREEEAAVPVLLPQRGLAREGWLEGKKEEMFGSPPAPEGVGGTRSSKGSVFS
ncbi:hypothetical protein JCM10213_005908 [Rhodosporidiobolus nylandii]